MALRRVQITIPGGGDCPPSIVWTDTPHFREVPVFRPKLPDALHFFPDGVLVKPSLTDILHVTDSKIGTVTASATKSEVLHTPEVVKGRVVIDNIARSGTPDADFMGDAWVDENSAGLPAPNGINHGNESALNLGGAILAPTARTAHLKWNLTRFAGFTAPTGGNMTVRLWLDASTVAVLQSVNFAFSETAGSPFTESTITGANNPANGANVVTKNQSALLRAVPTTIEYRMYEIILTPAEYGPYLGRWLMCKIDSDSLIATPYLVASREHVAGADGGQRPYLAFDFQR